MNEVYSLFVPATAAAIVLYGLTRVLQPRKALLHGPPRDSLIAGNLAQLFAPLGMEHHERFTKEYGNAFEVYGLFGAKEFFLSDAKAISTILANPDVFYETNAFRSIARVIFGSSLFAVTGHDHKKLRRMLNPVFTIRHIRDLLPVFQTISQNLKRGLAADIQNHASNADKTAEVNILDWVTRTALDLIGLGGLGYSFGALDGTRDPYSEAAKLLLPTVAEVSFITPFLHILLKLGPAWFRRLLVRLVPLQAVQRFREVVDVMDTTANRIFREKKVSVSKMLSDGKAGKAELEELKDVMSLTLVSNMQNTRLTDEELVAQMSTLIFAAVDTTSGAIVRTLQLLSTRSKIQERLRRELKEAKLEHGTEDLDFDTLDELPYLDAVCSEILRLHPPVSFMSRTSQAPFVLPLATPAPSASSQSGLVDALPLPAGTTVYISIQGVNRDPEIWGLDADDFVPERWLGLNGAVDEEKTEVNNQARELKERLSKAKIPSLWNSILSFSSGAHGCIGFKYGVIEMKVVLSALLTSFKFKPSNATVEWHLSLTQAPHVRTVDEKGKSVAVPGLPLIVEILDDE